MTDRTVVYRLQADIGQFRGQMAAAGASVKKAANDMTAGTKEGDKFRKGLDTLGGSAGRVGLVAAAGLGAAVMKAASFDKAMSSVQAATHESATAMEDLRQAALDAGADTAFSATEAAAGIENLAKAGVATADILNGGLAGALDLAAAGEMEVADAAEAAAGAMAQFGLDGAQVPHIADLMAAAAGKAQGDVSDFVMALKQGGTVAAQTGLSLEETTGALAAMAEQSLLGSDAGTSFKTMLGSLTPNSKKAADAMAAYNINAFDAQGNFVGMTELAGQLQAGLGDLTDEQRAMALETIFGSDAVRAASIIYDNGAEGIAKWTAQVDDAGFAAETAAIKQDNLRGDIEKLGGALETALIGTGSGAQGPLRGLTQGITKAVDAYNDLPQAAQTATAALMGGAALVGGSIWVGSKLVQGIANTRGAMADLGVTSGAVKGKLSGLVSFMGGPWGLALMTATVGLGAFMEQQAKTEGYVDSLRAALDDQSGAMTRQAIATNLNEEGWLEYAESIGLGADVVIDAALGSAEAMEKVKAASEGADGGMFSLDFTNDAGQLVDNIEAQGEAYAKAQKEGKLLADANGDVASSSSSASGPVADLGGAMAGAAEETESFKDMLDRLNDVLAGRSSLRDYEAAIDDFTAAIKKNGNTFDINTEKGRENQSMLDNIAGSALSVAESLDGAARKKFLTNAIADIRTMGERMGLPKSEVRALIALLEEANRKDVKPKIDVDPAAAKQKVEDLKARLEKLGGMKPTPQVDAQTAAAEAKLNNLLAMLREAERDRSSTVTTYTITRKLGPSTMGPRREADGGFIAGPGTATSDSIPAYLSNGEYVIKAAAVEKYGVHMFDRLNAMHFAGGGSVTKGDDDKKKRRRKFNGEQTEWDGGPSAEALEQAAMQAAEAAELYYAEQERAQRHAEELADEAAAHAERVNEEMLEAQREHDEAVLTGQQKAWDQMEADSRKRVDLAQQELSAVEANMDRMGKAATAAFSGSWFSGTQERGMWAGGAGTGDWRSQALGDVAGLQERQGLIGQLSAQGLTGAALEDLLGNQNNAGISAMLANGEIGEYASLFAQREALMASVGQQAGMAGYGSEYAAASAEMARMNAQFAALTAAIQAARPITVLESVSAQATAAEIARLMSMVGAA